MYLINGVALDDEDRGWSLLRGGTRAISGITKVLTSVRVPGYDGYFRAPSTRDSQALIFQMKSTFGAAEALFSLVDQPSLVISMEDEPTREARAELVSAVVSGEFPMDEIIYVTVTMNVYGAAWRDTDVTIFGPTTVTDPVQQVYLLDDVSAPVRDMDVFISGVFGQLQLVDSQGSWIKSTSAWSGSAGTGVLYVGSTGQFFRANTSAPWTPTGDVGHLFDVSGGGGFKITPELVGGDPDVRRGHLTLTTLTQTSATIRVRAKGAYAMQFGG